MEAAMAIIKKATTNSRHPRYLAILAKALTSHLPDQNNKRQEIIKIIK
jgi:hypothetical protein